MDTKAHENETVTDYNENLESIKGNETVKYKGSSIKSMAGFLYFWEESIEMPLLD